MYIQTVSLALWTWQSLWSSLDLHRNLLLLLQQQPIALISSCRYKVRSHPQPTRWRPTTTPTMTMTMPKILTNINKDIRLTNVLQSIKIADDSKSAYTNNATNRKPTSCLGGARRTQRIKMLKSWWMKSTFHQRQNHRSWWHLPCRQIGTHYRHVKWNRWGGKGT